MSSIPFVQVEGVLALPHIRPLARLPASFGREWALTVPHFSLRTELRALYAAIMRTMCLTAETFRAIYRWDHLRRPVPAAAAPVAPAPAARTPVSAPVGQDSRSTASSSASNDTAGNMISLRTPPSDRHRLAGGAVAIGGAAMLAWIVASHMPRESAPQRHAAVPNAQENPSHRLADARAQHEQTISRAASAPAAGTPTAGAPADWRASPARVAENTITSGSVVSSAQVKTAPPLATIAAAASSPVAIVSAPSASAIVVAPKAPAQPAASVAAAVPKAPAAQDIATPQAAATSTLAAPPAGKATVTSARVSPDFGVRTHAKTWAPATLVQRGKHRNERTLKHAEARRAENRGIAPHGAGTRSAHEFEPYRDTAPVTTRRSHGAYSEARIYSPRQTSANPADEYASVITYANTHTASPAANRAPVTTDSTDWVNHVSQRRVTEVPDRFAK